MHTRGRADRRREPRGRIPLESLVTDAVTLDLSSREPGAVGWSELEPLLGDLREGDWLFLYSDNGRNWGDEDYWTGWSYPDADASRGLVERGIVGIELQIESLDGKLKLSQNRASEDHEGVVRGLRARGTPDDLASGNADPHWFYPPEPQA